MITVKIAVEPHVAEYLRGKYFDPEAGAVHFPALLDVYILIFDLLQKRPASNPVDSGNLEICLPDRRQGKSPETYNYLSERSQKLLANKFRLMMWAELHDYMDEEKHLNGTQFKDTVFRFMRKYGIEAITEDALLKNYQRWRDKQRRRKKRGYNRRNCSN